MIEMPSAWRSVLLAVLAMACGNSPPMGTAPNVIILSVDTLRADVVDPAARDPISVPNLHRLYGRGTSFDNAITPMPRTTPALASMLSGQRTARHGSREVGVAMAEVTTLAELLARRGWHTMAVSANFTASPKEGLDRGFHAFVGAQDLKELYRERLLEDFGDEKLPDAVGWATATTNEALRSLGERPADRPFFLWVFYFDPHFIYLPPPSFQAVAERGPCWELYRYFDTRRHLGGQLYADVGGRSAAARDDCATLYRGEIEYFDREMGRLLNGLDELGLLANSLLVFTADHGENLGEGGVYFEHGSNVHESAIRVPLVFLGPGIAADRVETTPVSLVDLMPTVLTQLGVPQESWPHMDGEDLSALLTGGSGLADAAERIVFAESAASMWNEEVQLLLTGRPGHRVCLNDVRYTLCRPNAASPPNELFDHVADPGLSRNIFATEPQVVARLAAAMEQWSVETARERCARSARFKLVQRPALGGGFATQLYDLHSDSGESADVSDQYPDIRHRLQRALEEWVRQVETKPLHAPDDETEDRLRALGYLGD